MSDNVKDNPYAYERIAEVSSVSWADGNVLFSNNEISVNGDVRLPRLCIHTGKTKDLIRKDRKLSTVPRWTEYANDGLIYAMLGGMWSPLGGEFLMPVTLSFAGVATVIFVVRFCVTTIQVQWYVCRVPERLQILLTASPILCGLIGIAGYMVTDSLWWFALLVAASIARAQADRIDTIRFHERRNGRFILRSHSPDFAAAWQNKLNLPAVNLVRRHSCSSRGTSLPACLYLL